MPHTIQNSSRETGYAYFTHPTPSLDRAMQLHRIASLTPVSDSDVMTSQLQH